MKFDAPDLQNLPTNQFEAVLKIVKAFLIFRSGIRSSDERMNYYEEYLRAVAYLDGYLEAHSMGWLPFELVGASVELIVNNIDNHFTEIGDLAWEQYHSRLLESYKNQFKAQIETGFAYKFSDDDIERIQALINELRDMIHSSEAIDDGHKLRLQKRLETLQRELHKSTSDIDRFFGFMYAISALGRKIGEDAKPIVERVQEMAQIITKVWATSEGIPIESPLQLPNSETKQIESDS